MSAAETPPDQATETRSAHDSNSVKLRVTYLHAGNPRPPHELGSVPAETTVGALKSRLQNELLESPRPEEQRLIYQGRPLLQDTTTLREALRLSGPISPLPYTIHIIIQPRHAPSHFRPDTSANMPASPLGDGGQATGAAADPDPTPQPHLNHDHLNAQVERMHAAAQAHLNILNQQLHTLQQQHGMNPNQRFNTTVHVNGHLVQPVQLQPTANGQHAPTPTSDNSSARQTQPPAPPHGVPAHPQAFPGPVFLNAGQQFGNLPFQRPLSVPPPARAFGTPHPYGIPHPAPVFPPLPRLPGAMPIVGAAPHVNPPQPTEPTVWLASSRNGPEALLFAPGHGYFSSGGAAAALPQRGNVPIPNLQAQMNLLRSSVATVPTQNDRPAAQPRAAAPANPQQPPLGPIAGPLALQRPLQPGQPAVAQIRPRALDDDFMGLVIQRGWLFLRLYMFMFVLSEPGTWRRYFLLGLALIVCLLPRRNPLSHLMVAARRHIDNLIGPPAPQRPAAAPPTRQQPPQADGGPRPPPVRGAVNITPEQAATRILAEQQQQREVANISANNNQPPNVLRDTFYRIEQAVALFLASLIPGVGERHVAAREEQRRERLRVEMERANAERAAAEAAEEGRSGAEVQTGGLPGGEEQQGAKGGTGKEREVENSSSGEAMVEGVSTGVEATSDRGATSSSSHAEGSGEQQLRERAPTSTAEQEI